MNTSWVMTSQNSGGLKGNVGTFGSGTDSSSPMTLQWLNYIHMKKWLQVFKSRKIAEKAVRSKYIICTICNSKQKVQNAVRNTCKSSK